MRGGAGDTAVEPYLGDHQFEMRVIALRCIAEHLGERQGEQFGGDGFYPGHILSSCLRLVSPNYLHIRQYCKILRAFPIFG